MMHTTEVFSERVKLISFQELQDDIYVVTFRKIKHVSLDGLTFLDEGNTVIWDVSSACFTPATFMLLFHLWRAKERFLSKEEVREDVARDEEASDDVLRNRIAQARKELQAVDFPYQIDTVRAKGYRLVKT